MCILKGEPFMIIHVVRHAEAIERSTELPEEYRFLNRRGRKRFRKIAGIVKKAGMTPDLILTSPLIRAVQTAEILAERLRYEGELQVAQPLAPGFSPDALDELLDPHPEAGEVVLVGHEPDVGSLVQSLFNVKGGCALKKGAIVSFKRTAGGKGEAQFIQLVSGSKIVTSRSKALQRLQGDGAGK
jgi:phosphohistidine phosphatase